MNEHALWGLFQLIPFINPAMSAVMISVKKVVVQNFQSPQLEMSPLPKDYEISGIPQLRSCRETHIHTHTHTHTHTHIYDIYIYTYHIYIYIYIYKYKQRDVAIAIAKTLNVYAKTKRKWIII